MNIFLYLYVIICHILSIYNIKVTFWNKVQGGIIAVNGVISNSKVYPVQTISNLKGIGRDNTSAEHKAVKSLIARQWIWRLLLKLTTMHLLTAILLLTIIRASYSHFIIVLTTSILTDSGHTRKEAVTSGIIHTIYLLVITYSLYIIWTISDMTASFLFLFALLYFYWLNSFTI